ncbi:MAG TPA: hypothetical protein VH092_20335, partial [Urbifossiella sp.]|nr:hypothetical protein [Urbifossiella sp.]
MAALTVRTTDDPAIAFLDAWAVVLDVLTFYQERIANEGYLRPATEFRSVLELARLVGYQPRPPVGSSTYLAYTLEKSSNGMIPQGSRVTSTPGSGQLPQTFETSADLPAQDPWNALTPRQGRTQQFDPGQTTAGRRVWFTGLTTLLKPNDPLLLVFDAARGEPFRVKSVTPDSPSKTTRVVLQDFSTVSMLGDAAVAINQATKLFSHAVATFEDAEFDRLGGSDPNQSNTAHDTIETAAVTPILNVFNGRASGTITTDVAAIGELIDDLGDLLDDTSGLLAQLRIALTPAPDDPQYPGAVSNAQNLLAQYLEIQDYLIVQSVALQVIAVNGLPDAGPLKLTPQDAARYATLSAAWVPDAVRTVSAVTLANTLYDTQQFILEKIPAGEQQPFSAVIVLCGQVLTQLVRTIFRPVLNQFFNVPQAGIDPDTVVAKTVIDRFQLLIALTNARDFTAADRVNMSAVATDLATATQTYRIRRIDDFVAKAQALRDQLNNRTANPANAKTELLGSIDGLKTATLTTIPAVLAADAGITEVSDKIPDPDRDVVKTNINNFRAAAAAAGFTATTSG